MDAEVTREDQDKINRFGSLHAHLKELKARVDAEKEALAAVQDAQGEVLGMDEDETPGKMAGLGSVSAWVGETFFSMGDDAIDFLSAREAKAEEKIAALEEKANGIKKEMDTLKAELYGKFGRQAINLDD